MAVLVHLSHFKTTARRPIHVRNYRCRVPWARKRVLFVLPFFCRILPLKSWPRSSVKFYIRANDSQFTSTDLAVFIHLSHFKETARRPIQVTNYSGRVPLGQESNIFLLCRVLCRILLLKCWPRGSVKFFILANDSLVHLD